MASQRNREREVGVEQVGLFAKNPQMPRFYCDVGAAEAHINTHNQIHLLSSELSDNWIFF